MKEMEKLTIDEAGKIHGGFSLVSGDEIGKVYNHNTNTNCDNNGNADHNMNCSCSTCGGPVKREDD